MDLKSLILFQIALLLFIVHPILPSDFLCSGNNRIRRKIAEDLRKMLTRLVVCTLGCCVSSLQLNIALILITNNKITIYWPSVASVDLIITALCVVCTFSRWKERLFPFVEFSKNEGEMSFAESPTEILHVTLSSQNCPQGQRRNVICRFADGESSCHVVKSELSASNNLTA